MHIIKITPNLLFEYQCTSGKFIRLPNRIESKFFSPELECSAADVVAPPPLYASSFWTSKEVCETSVRRWVCIDKRFCVVITWSARRRRYIYLWR